MSTVWNSASMLLAVIQGGQVVTHPPSAPTLSSVSPNTLVQGVTNQNLTLLGGGFVSGNDTVVFSIAGITVNLVTVNTSGDIRCNVDVSGSATVTTGTVKVHSSVTGDSNTQPFSVTASSVNYNPTNLTTGAGILLTNPTAKPIWADWAAKYANNTAYKAEIFSGLSTFSNPSLAGTYSSGNSWNTTSLTGCHFGDGRYVDLSNWVSSPTGTYGPGFNEPCIENVLPGQNTANDTPTPILRSVFSAANIFSTVSIRRIAYCSTPAFTAVGDATNGAAITFNAGQGASWKSALYNNLPSGRAGLETANWNATDGDLDLLFDNGSVGFTETTWTPNQRTTAAYQNGNTLQESIILEQWERMSDSYILDCGNVFPKASIPIHTGHKYRRGWSIKSPRLRRSPVRRHFLRREL